MKKWFVLFLVFLVYFSFAQNFNLSFPRIKKLDNGEIKIDRGLPGLVKDSKKSNQSPGTEIIASNGLSIAKIDSLSNDDRFMYRNILSYEDDFKCVAEFGNGFRILVQENGVWGERFIDTDGYRTLLYAGVQNEVIYFETLLSALSYNVIEVFASEDKGLSFVLLGTYHVPIETDCWMSFIPLIKDKRVFNLIYSSTGKDSSYSVYYQKQDSFFLSGVGTVAVKSVYFDDVNYVLANFQGNMAEILVGDKGWGSINLLTPNYQYQYFNNLEHSVTAPVPMLRFNDTTPFTIINSEGVNILGLKERDYPSSIIYRYGLGVVIVNHFRSNNSSLVLFDDSSIRTYQVDSTFLARERNISAMINNNHQMIFLLSDGGVYEVKETVSGLNNAQNAIPDQFELEQNYPNPFNPSTKIKFFTPETGLTSLKVYDLLGREVATLVNEELLAGEHQVSFEASSLASGVYVYTLSAGKYTATKKMALLR
jgi:hypothetical protein